MPLTLGAKTQSRKVSHNHVSALYPAIVSRGSRTSLSSASGHSPYSSCPLAGFSERSQLSSLYSEPNPHIRDQSCSLRLIECPRPSSVSLLTACFQKEKKTGEPADFDCWIAAIVPGHALHRLIKLRHTRMFTSFRWTLVRIRSHPQSDDADNRKSMSPLLCGNP